MSSTTRAAASKARPRERPKEHPENHRYNLTDYEYIFTPTTYTKRQRCEDERGLDISGKPILVGLVRKRLRNEHAALQFLSTATSIPVPKVLDFSEHDGSLSLTVERIHAVTLFDLLGDDAGNEEYLLARINIERFVTEQLLPQLHALRSSWLGGISGDVVPHNRITLVDDRPHWPVREARPDETFVFCHNDLAPWNIFLDPQTLKVSYIIDWEYSGFYPEKVEYPYWRREPHQRGADIVEVAQLRDILLGIRPATDFRRRPNLAAGRSRTTLLTTSDTDGRDTASLERERDRAQGRGALGAGDVWCSRSELWRTRRLDRSMARPHDATRLRLTSAWPELPAAPALLVDTCHSSGDSLTIGMSCDLR